MLTRKYLKILFFSTKPNLYRNFSQEYVPKALRSLKAKSGRSTVQFYVDSQRIRAVAGNGGDGCISFLSVWCKDQAGPDGGDGGHGGHVIFQEESYKKSNSLICIQLCDHQHTFPVWRFGHLIHNSGRGVNVMRMREATHTVKSLNHCKAVTTANHGERGFNKDCTGKNAAHVIIPVPLGTIVKDASGKVVGDLNTEGVMFVAARGGAGGRGNKFFLTDTEQAPDVAELGAKGESNVYNLEVRSMAHIGLIGFPNAGKSTLLRALTRARPNVAPYPFTTLRPHIGIVPYDDYEQVAIADLPGLIPGSHKNYGLGIQFLQHVERCRGLIYLLDGTNEPLNQYESLSYELTQYNQSLSTRPNCIVVNKIDVKEGRIGFEEVKRGVLEANRGDSEAIMGDLEANVGDLETNRGNNEFDEELNLIQDNEDCVQSRRVGLVDRGGKLNVKVLGISAKTGINLSELLRIVREMYDSGEGEQT